MRILCAQLHITSDISYLLHKHMKDVIKDVYVSWQDEQFVKFSEYITPYQQQIDELSKNYKDLANKILY